MNTSKRSHTCPTCKTEVRERIAGAWPFCSKRCKMQDLGAWMREEYTIPGSYATPEEMHDALSQTEDVTAFSDSETGED